MLHNLNKSKTLFIAFVFSLATLTATTFIGCEKTDLCTSDNPPAGCFTCYTNDDCSGDKPVCDIPNNTCVECLESTQCTGDNKYCDTTSSTCVACLDSTQCTTPEAPVCDTTTFTCTGCTENTDCEAFPNNTICHNDKCVECTTEQEDDICGIYICVPSTNTCSDTIEQGSAGICQSCVSDTQCQMDHNCIAMLFNEDPRDNGYCLKLVSAGCEKPWTADTITSASLSGAPENDYCGIKQNLTTCEAVLELVNENGCPNGTDEECGAEGLSDGLCRDFGLALNQCTYPCDGVVQCKDGTACTNGYCQP
ncbi:MAG: hypothetical protein IPJ88_04870 [Myxococcales bacterium]|nr:MAG: hypothetical protein IPJ88_04870 [Myxococcales bacterium]